MVITEKRRKRKHLENEKVMQVMCNERERSETDE
jgi:hypothetical protein